VAQCGSRAARGRRARSHFTSVVAPEDSRRARELFSRKVLGTSSTTDATGVLVSTAGARVAVEISAVPLVSGERVVGVFGLFDGRADDKSTAPPPHLTPRQVEALRLLEQGRSTKQIAAELHLSTETVRNHIRRLFRVLGVHSRLEAVAAARAGSPDRSNHASVALHAAGSASLPVKSRLVQEPIESLR
jgi:DNA-binding NarL/FixJ family response regulator